MRNNPISLASGVLPEFLPPIQAAAGLAAGFDAAGIWVEPAMSRCGGSPADVAKLPKRLIAYAQFCDAPPALPDLSDVKSIVHEAVDLRLLPGEGSLPLDEFLEVLPARTPLSIELRSKALRDAYPDATDRALAVAQATRNYLNKTTIPGKN